MFDREITLYRFLHGYGRSLSADLDDDRLSEQPLPGVNHPAWLLGHLAICCDYALQLLDRQPLCPPEWQEVFGPGTVPLPEREAYPARAELIESLERGHQHVLRRIVDARPDNMARPHGLQIEFLAQPLPTVGDLLAHLITTHEAVHLGQLSAWRRMMGLPGVLKL